MPPHPVFHPIPAPEQMTFPAQPDARIAHQGPSEPLAEDRKPLYLPDIQPLTFVDLKIELKTDPRFQTPDRATGPGPEQERSG